MVCAQGESVREELSCEVYLSTKSGQSAYRTIGSRVFPCKVGLRNFQDMREERTEKGLFPRITFSEGLASVVESSFLGFTDVEVTNHNPKRSRKAGPMRRDKAQSFRSGRNEDTITRPYGHNVITALQVVTCETIAPSGRRFFRIKIADPPALTLCGTNVPNSRNCGTST